MSTARYPSLDVPYGVRHLSAQTVSRTLQKAARSAVTDGHELSDPPLARALFSDNRVDDTYDTFTRAADTNAHTSSQPEGEFRH